MKIHLLVTLLSVHLILIKRQSGRGLEKIRLQNLKDILNPATMELFLMKNFLI